MTKMTGALMMAGAVLLGGCASRSAGGTAPGGSRELRAEEIMSVNASTMYDVIRVRRSQWLRRAATRPTAFPGRGDAQVVVYLDGQRFGEADMLRQIAPATVHMARFLTASEAEMKYGSNLLGGVIDVQSQGAARRPDP